MIIHHATMENAAEMADILNKIIVIGGTSAYEQPKSVQEVAQNNITGPNVICSIVAQNKGRVIGWQSAELWQGDAYIGTFVRPEIQAQGVGVAMFALTLETLKQAGMRTVIALIRADNVPGLRYYARLGFVDFANDPDFALETGQVVGRVYRRYDVV